MPPNVLLTVTIFYSLVLFIPVALALLYFRPALWYYLLALFLGVIIGWLDLRATDVQGTILLLITFGAFLGFAKPRQAWLWGILLAIWIPIGAFAATALGVRAAAPAEPAWFASAIAFIPAFIGAYLGALVNRASAHVPRESSALPHT